MRVLFGIIFVFITLIGNSKHKVLTIKDFCNSGSSLIFHLDKSFRIKQFSQISPGECGFGKREFCVWIVYNKKKKEKGFAVTIFESDKFDMYKYDSNYVEVKISNWLAKIFNYKIQYHEEFYGKRVFIYGKTKTIILDFNIDSYDLIPIMVESMEIIDF